MVSKDYDYIFYEFLKFESVIRLVICILVFGLGISILDIEVVIYWGVGLLVGSWKGGMGWKESKSFLLCDVWFIVVSF